MTCIEFYTQQDVASRDLEGNIKPSREMELDGIPAILTGQKITVSDMPYVVERVEFEIREDVFTILVFLA